jgi:hypothetical protein
MISHSDGGLACDEFTETVQIVDERVRAGFSEPGFYGAGDLVRVIHETGGIYDAAHGAGLVVATDRRASFQFAGERILAFEGAPLADVGQAALDRRAAISASHIIGHARRIVGKGDRRRNLLFGRLGHEYTIPLDGGKGTLLERGMWECDATICN